MNEFQWMVISELLLSDKLFAILFEGRNEYTSVSKCFTEMFSA